MLDRVINAAELGKIPTPLIRLGIWSLLKGRVRDIQKEGVRDRQRIQSAMDSGPIAVKTALANEQHYEVPARFYELVLGPQLKYSSGFYPGLVGDLAAGEEAMLKLTCERSQLVDGQDILELGCGWGSLTLYMARRYPRSRILAVSNSSSQKDYILGKARREGLQHVEVETMDMNDFATKRLFDRIVSVEMFEHMRNYRELLRRIRSCAKPDAKLFIHIFTHRSTTYFFEEEGSSNWMGRHFFSGGMMPSQDLMHRFSDLWKVEFQDNINGIHYARTCEQWLRQLDAQKREVVACLPGRDPERQYYRWRMFFLACAGLFSFEKGHTWGVSHYRLV